MRVGPGAVPRYALTVRQHLPHIPPAPALAATLGASLVLAACQGPFNESINPGREPLATFADPPPAPPPLDGPSLTGPDRGHWPHLTVAVPINQVQSNPDYTWSAELVKDTRRQRGQYPTAQSALDVEETTPGHYAEGGLNVAMGFGAVVLVPYRVVTGDGPWDEQRNPRRHYERVPGVPQEDYRRWIGTESEVADDPETPPSP